MYGDFDDSHAKRGGRFLALGVVFFQMSGAMQAYDSILPLVFDKSRSGLDLDEGTIEALFQSNLKPIYFDRVERTEHPVLRIVTGLSGAGKSFAIAPDLLATAETNWVLIDFKSPDVRALLRDAVVKGRGTARAPIAQQKRQLQRDCSSMVCRRM